MIPDERTCQYFITIAREKNISRAARSLYISQPTLKIGRASCRERVYVLV